MLRIDFFDSGYWELLANKHLPSHDLPDWHESCQAENMAIWMHRLDLDDYETITNTTNEEFIQLNKDWPLRAFIGLLLEHKDGQRGKGSGVS